MKISRAYVWHKRLKNGCENVEDNERCGCPIYHRTDESAERVRNLVQFR
jgi:hypothetical protein